MRSAMLISADTVCVRVPAMMLRGGGGGGFSRVERKLFALFEILINLTKALQKLPTFKKLSMKFKYSSNEIPIKFQ